MDNGHSQKCLHPPINKKFKGTFAKLSDYILKAIFLQEKTGSYFRKLYAFGLLNESLVPHGPMKIAATCI